jgi:hypothetical protein
VCWHIRLTKKNRTLPLEKGIRRAGPDKREGAMETYPIEPLRPYVLDLREVLSVLRLAVGHCG